MTNLICSQRELSFSEMNFNGRVCLGFFSVANFLSRNALPALEPFIAPVTPLAATVSSFALSCLLKAAEQYFCYSDTEPLLGWEPSIEKGRFTASLLTGHIIGSEAHQFIQIVSGAIQEGARAKSQNSYLDLQCQSRPSNSLKTAPNV